MWLIGKSLNNLLYIAEQVLKVPSFKLNDSKIYVTITGARDVSISDIDSRLSTLDEISEGESYQLFDASKVAGVKHLYYAAANAEYALSHNLNISNNLNIETLLYASCENQIYKAIKTLGVSPNTTETAVALFSEEKNDPIAGKLGENLGETDGSVLDLNQIKYNQLMDAFKFNETAINCLGKNRFKALRELITEKGALISLGR